MSQKWLEEIFVGRAMIGAINALFKEVMEQTPKYPKGDLRRMLAVLAAIDSMEGATLVRLAERTGIDKKTVINLIEQAREQAGVVVAKIGAVYSIEEWGPVIKKGGAKMCLTGALNAPRMNAVELGTNKESKMEPKKLKEMVVGSINYTFNAWVNVAVKASSGGSKAVPAMQGMQRSIVAAATSVDARVYADDEFSAKIVMPGIDLAYRTAVVSDVNRDDEWIAALAIDFNHLDEHTRKVLHSHVDRRVKNSNLAGAEARRLLLSLVCAEKVVTLDTFFTVAVETSDKKLALVPAPPSWAIPQRNGQHLVINHMHEHTYQERLDIASRRLSVIDSASAATLINAHARGESEGPMH